MQTSLFFAQFQLAGGYCQFVMAARFRYFVRMHIPTIMPRLKGFRFPREITAYAVLVYTIALR